MSRISTPELVNEKLQGSPYPPSPPLLSPDEFDAQEPEVDNGKGNYFSDISNEDLAIIKQKECLQEILDFLLQHEYSHRVCRAALAVYSDLPVNISSSSSDESYATSESTIVGSPVALTDRAPTDLNLSGVKAVDSDPGSEQ